MKIMKKEAEAKGISLSTLLRAIVEEHYGIKSGVPVEKAAVPQMQKVIDLLGEAKMKNCQLKEDCPLKRLELNPSPPLCALCQIHDHGLGPFPTSVFNPYVKE
jgi:hypothetical protein